MEVMSLVLLHVRMGKFYCENEGHVPVLIFSSRVYDGICDCCDGSDEAVSSSCVNTCKQAWEESIAQTRIDIQEHEQGIGFTMAKQKTHLAEREQKQKELTEKKDAKSNLLPKLEELNSRKTTLQQQMDEKTEIIRQEVTAQIEPEVLVKYEAKQAEKVDQERILAEIATKAQTESHEEPKDGDQDGDQDGNNEPVAPVPEPPTEEEIQKQLEEEKNNH